MENNASSFLCPLILILNTWLSFLQQVGVFYPPLQYLTLSLRIGSHTSQPIVKPFHVNLSILEYRSLGTYILRPSHVVGHLYTLPGTSRRKSPAHCPLTLTPMGSGRKRTQCGVSLFETQGLLQGFPHSQVQHNGGEHSIPVTLFPVLFN